MLEVHVEVHHNILMVMLTIHSNYNNQKKTREFQSQKENNLYLTSIYQQMI
jgi:hypothetical protein